ncbi:metallophosphoesterase [Thermobrachium celere]|uniref:Metallophosphoesterase, calcineurin superfamily n=1 Tax=Thermobrachium celere DSM 8682 TaxID=941824 RepID=R7RTV2_9CLOT|nr:metallophosphoesterase [Thermobrachium celere]CDF58680.1 metallophosphoesterase, calcineurin superfamily [Thermobrachium celere DSM 8682]
MKKFIHTLYYISGKIYIPSSLLKVRNTILHISDTPSNIYPELIRLVKKLSPDYIIHTGDVVDNIKLELYPFKLKEYEKLSINFIKSLTPLVKKKL